MDKTNTILKVIADRLSQAGAYKPWYSAAPAPGIPIPHPSILTSESNDADALDLDALHHAAKAVDDEQRERVWGYPIDARWEPFLGKHRGLESSKLKNNHEIAKVGMA